jgi:fluoride ion exporter CrcB/FEX
MLVLFQKLTYKDMGLGIFFSNVLGCLGISYLRTDDITVN